MPRKVLSDLLWEPVTPEEILAYIKIMYRMARVKARILDLNDISNEIEIQFHPTPTSGQRRGWFPLVAGAKHIASLVNSSQK